MPLDEMIPSARKPIKIALPTKLFADLDAIAARHYEDHKAAYDEAKADRPTAEDVAMILLKDAIERERRPARKPRKKANGGS